MDKLTPKDGSSPDIVAENIERLREIFPEVFADGSMDFDTLKQTLGSYVDDREERYSFTWHGKSRARRIAQMPSSGTLLPCKEESVNWDSTQNIFIEGDNLEVLKILQKSYHRKVKMIYIDPPYNTGKEFIYPDKYQDNLDTYLKYTGQVDDEGFKLSANTETSGRYHTNWLNMMYPRLKLARNLLRDDGVIFASIDDNEVQNLRQLMDEIFGPENFVATLTWQKTYSPANDKKGIDAMHDYILCYSRSAHFSAQLLPRTAKQDQAYKNLDNDPRGPWKAVDATRAEHRDYAVYEIETPSGKGVWPARGRSWVFRKEEVQKLMAENRLWFGRNNDSKPSIKRFLSEVKAGLVPTTWVPHEVGGHNDEAKKELNTLVDSEGSSVFGTPKPTRLIKHLMAIALGDSTEPAIILDFFAGSATTGDAVLRFNHERKRSHSFILVQLPEKTVSTSHPTIFHIGLARIKALVSTLHSGQDSKTSSQLGFKVFKLSSSNIKAWDAAFAGLEGALLDAIDNIKPSRNQEGVLYELLLKYGLGLTIHTDGRVIEGKDVFITGRGALVVCLEHNISLDVVRGIAALKNELKPEIMRVVFRDSGFQSDVVKTNTIQILKQAGIDNIKSV
jgi:adenine-specific DNA-methyltransferase